MTEEQFSELRDYADGMPMSTGRKPSLALVRNGWLRLVFDDFYEITPRGKRAFDEMRKPVAS